MVHFPTKNQHKTLHFPLLTYIIKVRFPIGQHKKAAAPEGTAAKSIYPMQLVESEDRKTTILHLSDDVELALDLYNCTVSVSIGSNR